jgi:hypothetical protein
MIVLVFRFRKLSGVPLGGFKTIVRRRLGILAAALLVCSKFDLQRSVEMSDFAYAAKIAAS